MMKPTKKIAGLLLACMTAMSQIVPVHAEEPDDFDETDRPVLENTTDVSRMPGYTEAELSDVYGQNDTANAEEIDSMFSDEAMEAFIQKMDETLNYEPSEQEDLSSILQKKEAFIQSGGVQAYLEDKDLVRGSEIGLCNNRMDKVRILGTEANASSWIYIVDKDAMVFIVKDENENGIPNAVVTITWTDDEGKRIVDSIVASDGGAPGVASFTGMPESFHGIVDIQAEGYRAVTIFDRNMGTGEHYIYQLKKAEENDLYIRGADLSGKDLVNEETEIVLMNSDTEDLDLRVLVTKRGNESFPSTIDLYSENRERTVYTLSNTSVYDVSSDTRIYSAKKRWVEQSADLFKEDDLASVKFKDRKFVFEHMSFVNTAAKPGLAASQMPMTTKPMDGKVTDRLSGSGVLDLTAEILQVPVQIGVFPNGDCVIVASYDITKLDPNTQYKYSSLFEKAWNPKTLKNAEDCLEIFEKSFWENAKYVKDGKKKLESADKVGFLANKNYNFAMNFSLYLKANHNKETNDCYGSGGIMFSASLSGGVTEYFLFMAGPIVIPAYIGFEAGFAINTSLNINFGVNQPPVAEASDVKWAYAAGGSEEVSARIETLVSFSVFGGVGVKGVLGASATGYVNFDIATVLGKGKGNIFTDEPHSFIDVLYGLKFHYYLLFFTGQITLECVNGAKRLWDSRGEHDLIAEEISQIVFTDLSLRDCADRLIPLLSEGSGDTAYTIENNPAVSAGKGIINVDAKTYPDAQIQFAAAKNRTALFRIVSDGEKTKLVYQLQDPVTGNLEETVYEVQLPDERSVTEFVVAANKTDDDQPEYCDNVYIGAILADNTISAMADRARTTDVAAIVVNLAEHKTIRSEIVSDQSEVYKSNYYYSAPLPAGAEDYCAVAYTASYIRDLQTDTELLEALASPSQNFLAAYTNEKPDEHVTVGLGYGKVYSTGVIAPYEPSFWMVDQIHSTDKTLSIEGIAANGYYSYDDPRCRTIVDISDHPAEDFDYSNIISNWHFLNGRNYFIVNDSVWWMDKVFTGDDHTQYTWSTKKVSGSSHLSSADYRYTMISDPDKAAVYIVSVIGDYQTDLENGTAEKTANRVQIYPVITKHYEWEGGVTTCTLHGPLTIDFAHGDPIINFAAAFNPKDCESKGISLVYSTPVESSFTQLRTADATIQSDDEGPDIQPGADTVALRMWKQNADHGMRIVKASIDDYAIRNDQKTFVLKLTVRNYGYNAENYLMFSIHDEAGHKLTMTDGKDEMSDDDKYYIGPLYAGDSQTIGVIVQTYLGWKVDEEHEIIAEVLDQYYYHGDLDDIVNTAKVSADNTTLTAENTLAGDKHYVSLSIENHCFTGLKTPKIKAILDYGDSEKEETKTFVLPTHEYVRRFKQDDNENEEIWNYDIDMDQIWKDGLKEGLCGAVFLLVDEDGNQVSNEALWLPNPAEEIKDKAVGMKTDEDGSPLAGAEFTLYNALNEEIAIAVSEEDGSFTFTNLLEGSYVIKETKAPEGYVKDDSEFAFNAKGDGETFSFTAVNRQIKGNIRLTLTDEKGSPVNGAKFAVYQGDTLIGYLKAEGKGVYTYADLPYGEYTIRCEKTPKGFEAIKPLDFAITEDGKTIELKATAERIRSESADTGDTNKIGLYLPILVMSLAAIVFVLIQRRKTGR